MKLHAKLHLWRCIAFLALSRTKWFKLGLSTMKLGTQHHLVYFFVLKWLKSITIVICMKIRTKLGFWGFLSIFYTFSHKVVQTMFVWYETWHTTIFCICYNFKMFRIKNNSHMFEITCVFEVFFSVFSTFSNKVVQTWFIYHETWHTTLFGIPFCVELGRLKTDSHMLETTCKVTFLKFF